LVLLRACSVWIASRRLRPRSQIFDRLFAIGGKPRKKGQGPSGRTVLCCAMHNNTNPHAMLEPRNAIRDRNFRSANLVARPASKPGKARSLSVCRFVRRLCLPFVGRIFALVREPTPSGKKSRAQCDRAAAPVYTGGDSLPRGLCRAGRVGDLRRLYVNSPPTDSTRPWSRLLPCPIYLLTFGIRSQTSAALA
jgi:hypothetical protein